VPVLTCPVSAVLFWKKLDERRIERVSRCAETQQAGRLPFFCSIISPEIFGLAVIARAHTAKLVSADFRIIDLTSVADTVTGSEGKERQKGIKAPGGQSKTAAGGRC
jgi:hypothetical protein